MRRLFNVPALLSVSLILLSGARALAAPKDDVQAALQKLEDAKNYSWTTTTTGGFGANSDGKTEKDGYTVESMTMRNNTVQLAKKGDQAVAQTDDGWKTAAELAADENAPRGLANALGNIRTPADQAKTIVDAIPAFTVDQDKAYAADLPTDTVKQQLTFRRRGNAPAPDITDPKGTVRVWIDDSGNISKLELHVTGTVSYNGNDRDIDRTTTTEIKDIGTTTVDVPADAKTKLDAPTTAPTTQP